MTLGLGHTALVRRAGTPASVDAESGQPTSIAYTTVYDGACLCLDGPFRVPKIATGDERPEAMAKALLPPASSLLHTIEADTDIVTATMEGIIRSGRVVGVKYQPGATWVFIDWLDHGAFA